MGKEICQTCKLSDYDFVCTWNHWNRCVVVAPALGDTAMNLGRNIQAFIPQVQEWAENIFQDNKEIVKWIGSMEFKWDEMIKSGIDFFKNGAGSVLGSTLRLQKVL